jgi:hypothetical protein
MRTVPLLAASALATSLISPVATQTERPSVKEDAKLLQGEWKTAADAKVKIRLEVKDRLISLDASGPGVKVTFSGLEFKLVEEGKKRIIDVDDFGAGAGNGTPSTFVYQLEKDRLILIVEDVLVMKGEHRLERVKK